VDCGGYSRILLRSRHNPRSQIAQVLYILAVYGVIHAASRPASPPRSIPAGSRQSPLNAATNLRGAPTPNTAAGATSASPGVVAPPNGPWHYLPGVYSGKALLTTRGTCALSLEIRADAEHADGFNGYSTLACTPIDLPTSREKFSADMLARLQPTSTIMTGTAQGSTIHFKVDDVVSGADGCAPTDFTVKTFGQREISVQWLDSCRGGMMVLPKTGR
jgi:hypothetical protein